MKIDNNDRIAALTLMEKMECQYGPEILESAKDILAKAENISLKSETAPTSEDISPAMACAKDMKKFMDQAPSGTAILSCVLMEDSLCPIRDLSADAPNTPILKMAMTRDDALAFQAENGYVRGYVLIPSHMVRFYSAHGGLQTFFSNAIVENGVECITSIKYIPVQEKDGVIKVLVTAVIDPEEAAIRGSRTRFKELLDTLINQKIEEAGMDVTEVIDDLLDIGFTPDELVEEFNFDADDVHDAAGDSDDDEDDDSDDDEDDDLN